MTFREFLLSRKGWQDVDGNTAVFSAAALSGEETETEIWLFLDEGLRCGGMHRCLAPTAEAVGTALLGVGKAALWRQIAADWQAQKEDAGCFPND